MKKFLSILFLFAAIPAFSQNVPSFIRDSIDVYVNRSIKRWQIPGVAIAIVKDGKVVFINGYGVRELGSKDKVDSNTLFMIGSNSKAFTATALAKLEAEKKLSLNDRVQKWLPDFKMYDPWVAKEATLTDLLCHRLGFETFQGDFMFFDSDLNATQVRERFGRLKPIYSMRSKWGYTNAAFLTAGEIIPAVTGKTWGNYLLEEIFKPLEMTSTVPYSRDLSQATNKSAAHTIHHGVLQKIAYGNIDGLAAAGSISSSASDMTHWVMTLLDTGKYNGKQIIPKEAIMATRQPQSILGNGGHPYNRAHFLLYGLGWFLEVYEGRKLVEHTGGVNGFVTSVCLVPEENLGIIVLSNTDSNNFFEALRLEILDAYLQLPYRGYSDVWVNHHNTREKQRAGEFKSKQDTIALKLKTAVPLKNYAGTYTNEVYGKMTITLEKGVLTSRFENHSGRYATLGPLGENRFLAMFSQPILGDNIWAFKTDGGKVSSVTVRVADFVEFTPYEFKKVD
jgi:CubicO group peptidase (beta-lactamase class C family)